MNIYGFAKSGFLIAWGMSYGMMQASAMLEEQRRPAASNANQVALYNNENLIEIGTDYERFGRDWRRLCIAFRRAVEGNRTGFDELLSSQEDPLNPACHFAAVNIFSRILNHGGLSTLASNDAFFKSMRNGFNLHSDTGYIDRGMVADLLLLKMKGLIPEEVSNEIRDGITEVIKARVQTDLMRENLKQFEMECEKELKKVETEAKRELIRSEVERIKSLMELEIAYKASLLEHEINMRKIEELDRLLSVLDAHRSRQSEIKMQEELHRLQLQRDQRNQEAEEQARESEERRRNIAQIAGVIKDAIGVGLQIGAFVMSARAGA